MNKSYSNKANRDAEATRLRSLGFTVRKSSTRGQSIWAHYVADLNVADAGIANYQRYSGTLYNVEAN